MRVWVVLVFIVLLAKISLALTSTPEALIPVSGSSEGSIYENFAVVGSDVGGIIYSSTLVSGVGLASAIFTPLLPMEGQWVPTVPTSEGETVSYPNPFNPDKDQSITIAFKYNTDAEVKVLIFDITGQLIQTLVGSSANRGMDGYSRIAWNGRSGFGETVENGVYLVNIISGGKTIAKSKLLVMR